MCLLGCFDWQILYKKCFLSFLSCFIFIFSMKKIMFYSLGNIFIECTSNKNLTKTHQKHSENSE